MIVHSNFGSTHGTTRLAADSRRSERLCAVISAPSDIKRER